MAEAIIIGIDLGKRFFHAHGAGGDGSVLFRKKLTRAQVLPFLSAQPRCTVAMEACATAHEWGRAIKELGHEVELIAPVYVKPFVKRQKNDANDAEAIAEAASRPTMRFVPVKTREQQARAVLFRTRDLLVRQRTQLVNALRGHLAEFGIVAPQGLAHLKTLCGALAEKAGTLPSIVCEMGALYMRQIEALGTRIDDVHARMREASAANDTTKRMQTMPGVGPVTAMAIEAFAPPMHSFRRGRDFAAWIGLAPRQHGTGGRQTLGKVSKMGQRDIRRLLMIGAASVVRAASRNGPPEGSWLARMLARKPPMLVIVALANKMARGLWAMLAKNEDFRNPGVTAAV